MLVRVAICAISLVVLPSVAVAQGTAPKPASVELTKDGKPKASAVRKACREEGKGKGLKGKALKASVDECFAKQRPDLAKNKACRQEAEAKKISGKERRDFMKTCRAA
jgi:hypothetical protein